MRASQLPTAHLSERSEPSTKPAAAKYHARRLREAPLVLDRYRLQSRLGSGGFGTVWLARDERLDREVAVKILPPERIPNGRFEREARAAARLSHPGIVTLYEAAVDDQGAYLVSELVRGATLDELLEQGRLSDRDILEIAIALCDALGHAHAHGIIHRDVKPSNVLIPERPSAPPQPAKLTDFGVARVTGGDSLTRTGDVVGTVAYMAPEQAEGREAHAPADLYALALVTYEALTGVNPVHTSTAAQRARRLGAYLPPLRRQRRQLPRELGRAIDLALRPRPRERGTLDELRGALAQCLPLVEDHPGVVTGARPRRADRGIGRPDVQWTDGPMRSAEQQVGPVRSAEQRVSPHAPPGAPSPGIDKDGCELQQHARWPARALAAAAAAASTGWLTAHLLAPTPLAPAVAALAAALLIASLPRLGWLTLTTALIVVAGAQQRPGAVLILALASLTPVVLNPVTGTDWPLAAGAPALALLTPALAGAWPALAARAPTVWRRAALGASGWIWLVLASPINGAGLYLAQPAPSPAQWTTSLQQTVDLVLRPILSAGAFAPAAVWALAAVLLPWIVRGRSISMRIVLVAVWAATLVFATAMTLGMVHSPDGLLGTGTAALGAIAGAIAALAPAAVEALPIGRARAGLP